MADELYIGIDLGTTGIKAGLFDRSGAAVAVSSREIQLETPSPGFAEFDTEAYTDLAFDAIHEVLAAPGADAGAVRAIGLSSQAQTFVLLDDAGRVLRPAISWLDVRAEAEAKELSQLAARLGAEEVNAIASAPKVLWLRRHEPGVIARARYVHVIPDHLIYRLTGRAATDPVTAASTGACDCWSRQWIDELLEACGLDAGMMPDVLSPGEAAGHLTADAAQRLGLSEDVVAVVGTNDQYAGALGAGNASAGCASLTLGTALALVATSTTRDGVTRGVIVNPHPAAGPGGDLYALMAYAKTAGVLVRWFRDTFAPLQSYDELFAEIDAARIGANGLLCLPHFSGTGTPDFDPSARGAFVGLTLAHDRAHLARALAESLAFTVRESVELLGPSVHLNELRAIGGGAKSDVWLQMIADVTGLPVERPRTSEAACLGAAALGMVGAGRFSSVAEAARGLYRPSKRFEPNPGLWPAYQEAFEKYQALYQAMYGKKEQTPSRHSS